jgi:hypothetical protein
MEHIKRLLIVSIFLVVGLQLLGQSSFYKTYVGSAFDKGEGVVQLPDSTFAVTGGSGAFSSNSGQAYLMLTDSLGEQLWTKSYGGFGSDWGRRVFYNPGVGFTITGTTNSTADGRYNFYVVNTDENGNLISEKNFGTANWEQMWDATLLDDGGLIMVGETEGETSEKKDIYIARIDNVGDTLWTQIISSGEDDVAYAVDTLNDTTVVIGGYSWDGTQSNALLISMHIDGTENWRSFYGSPGSAKINDVEVYDNEIFCSGEIIQQGEQQSDLMLLRIDASGIELNSNSFVFNQNDWGTDIAVKDDTSLYVSWSSVSSDLNVFPDGYDVFVSRFDKFLFFQNFSQGYSGFNNDDINELIVSVDSGVVFLGSCGKLRTEPTVSTSVMMGKIGPNDEITINADIGNDLVSIYSESLENELQVYPNPTDGLLSIEGFQADWHIEIYSVLGKKVFEKKATPKINISNLKNGVYLLHVIDGSNRSIHRIVKR